MLIQVTTNKMSHGHSKWGIILKSVLNFWWAVYYIQWTISPAYHNMWISRKIFWHSFSVYYYFSNLILNSHFGKKNVAKKVALLTGHGVRSIPTLSAKDGHLKPIATLSRLQWTELSQYNKAYWRAYKHKHTCIFIRSKTCYSGSFSEAYMLKYDYTFIERPFCRQWQVSFLSCNKHVLMYISWGVGVSGHYSE